MPPTPEQQARQQIDTMLEASGWVVQDYNKLNPSVSRGIAIREVPLKTGPCDYLLLVDRKPVGVIEAKRVGLTLSTVAEQSANYAENLPDFLAELCPADLAKLPFAYESTGVETLFRDERDPQPRSRRVFSFHRPETLAEWLDDAIDDPTHPTLRTRLAAMPAAHPLATGGMRACQIEAITNLETSLAADRPRALLKMATGSGKTYTACAFSYRLIKHAGARRILFLVDRANLGKQAKGEFDQFHTPDANRKFTELYNVQHLTSNKLDPVARVTICTIQRLYSMLRGETDLAEDLDEHSTADLSAADNRPRDVAYNPAIPIETFDFIVVDECHRSIYNLWRQVLEYFDAHLIGLSATPSAQTVAFFNQNLVMDYGHERAVSDNVNVGYDVYRIRTHITEHGATIEKGYHVTKRDRQTRALRQQLLDTDLAYAPAQLDRTVVNPSQIRTILQALRDALATELFPGRALVPKTLIFAKDDSHAEEIVHLTREVFGRGNDFCKKITYQSKHHITGKPAKKDDLIAEFRNSPTLRIAVTVDMIATGTDIKALECLVFLRDVQSLGYFEQMKGRGTRVLTPTELQSVSGADARAKTHFVIVDAVGVCESDKTESQPLDKQPTVALKNILLSVPLGKRDDDTLSTLASRLTRLERQLTPAEITAKILPHTGGKTLGEIACALLESLDPDKIAAEAIQTRSPNAAPDAILPEPTVAELAAAKKELTAAACAPFDNPDFREALLRAKRENEQTIDTANPDHVIARGLDPAAREKAQNLLKDFRAYLETHRAEITALQILYSRPYKQRLTETALKELETKLRDENVSWNEETLWNACHTTAPERVKGRSAADRFADLIPLVRYALEKQPELRPFAETVQDRFNNWLMDKAAKKITFTPDQLAWLHDIRDHIATVTSIDPDDFDYAPFTQRGGLGKAHQLFGDSLPALLEELNEVLVA